MRNMNLYFKFKFALTLRIICEFKVNGYTLGGGGEGGLSFKFCFVSQLRSTLQVRGNLFLVEEAKKEATKVVCQNGKKWWCIHTPGPGCSILTSSLVNVSLKFQTLISQICQDFLLKKCEKLLQCKSFSHFFNKKYQCIWL